MKEIRGEAKCINGRGGEWNGMINDDGGQKSQTIGIMIDNKIITMNYHHHRKGK